jgi:hypothetical protein
MKKVDKKKAQKVEVPSSELSDDDLKQATYSRAHLKRNKIIEDEDEDLGATIKRRVRRVLKPGEEESDYDLNAESEKEERKAE